MHLLASLRRLLLPITVAGALAAGLVATEGTASARGRGGFGHGGGHVVGGRGWGAHAGWRAPVVYGNAGYGYGYPAYGYGYPAYGYGVPAYGYGAPGYVGYGGYGRGWDRGRGGWGHGGGYGHAHYGHRR